MGLRDHFRRSSSQPPPFYPPAYQPHSGPSPGPPPQAYNHHQQAPHQPQPTQHLAPPEPQRFPHPTSNIPLTLHLTYDSRTGKSARLTTDPDPHSPTLYHLTTHSRSPKLRFSNTQNHPFATATIHIARSIDIALPASTFSIPALGWNVWEYTYISPVLGGRAVTWRTPQGPFGDGMECVFAEGGLPVCRWEGQGWAIGAKKAGRLVVVPELSAGAEVVDELVVVALGIWWARLMSRNGVYV